MMQLPAKQQFIADVKRLSRHAAAFGFVLALICHMLPPHYRAVCNTIASLCSPGR
jgi:hypothetical protein